MWAAMFSSHAATGLGAAYRPNAQACPALALYPQAKATWRADQPQRAQRSRNGVAGLLMDIIEWLRA